MRKRPISPSLALPDDRSERRARAAQALFEAAWGTLGPPVDRRPWRDQPEETREKWTRLAVAAEIELLPGGTVPVPEKVRDVLDALVGVYRYASVLMPLSADKHIATVDAGMMTALRHVLNHPALRHLRVAGENPPAPLIEPDIDTSKVRETAMGLIGELYGAR